MPISPARVAAFDILLRVDEHDAFASELLHASRYQKLSSADHRLATELVMGVLRWRSLLDQTIRENSSLPLDKLDRQVLTALRLAAYQLMFLDRVPQPAAIFESVELVKRARKRSAAAFTNALLRHLAGSLRKERWQTAIETSTTTQALARLSAHPRWLVTRWAANFGWDAAKRICTYGQRVPGVSLVIREPGQVDVLEKQGIQLGPGFLLTNSRRVITGDLAQLRRAEQPPISIQDEGSQLVALLVGRGSQILDCCAAPGGKAHLLADRNPRARIVATELHPHRARLLRKLVPALNLHVVVADARILPTQLAFDRVLADVPCSGTGTLARNPEIKWRLTRDDLVDLHRRQLEILRSVMSQVAPGGRLVYSTCSLEKEENEQVVEAALEGERSFRVLDCGELLDQLRAEGELADKDLDSLTRGPYLQTIPGIHPCDGFFAAILEKTPPATSSDPYKFHGSQLATVGI
ncbi:MAG TPA: transcription antitermination factor NusB [Terriglobales bacterium]|nr:transcription antitermination factor NusB [Terriglobales bacterium]